MIRSSIPAKYIENTRPRQDDIVFRINVRDTGVSERMFVQSATVHIVDRDGPLEIFDVMCSRDDVIVDLFDLGMDTRRARIAGPWLRHREVALVELLQVANDLITEGDKRKTATAVDLVRQAITEMPNALITPVVLAPSSVLRIDLEPLTAAATGDPDVVVWCRAVQWRNL